MPKPEGTGGEPCEAGGESDNMDTLFDLSPGEWAAMLGPDGLLDMVRRSRAWRGSLPLHPAPA